MEEEEEEEENLSEDCVSLTDSSLVPSECPEQNVSTRSSLARPCSIPRPTTLSKTSTTKTMKNVPDNQPANDNKNLKTTKIIQNNSPKTETNHVKAIKHFQNNSPRTEKVKNLKNVKNHQNNEKISPKTMSFQRPLCKKPTNLDFVNIRLVNVDISLVSKDDNVQGETEPLHSSNPAAPGAGHVGLGDPVPHDPVRGQGAPA